LTPGDLPASCRIIPGVYPAGVRTAMLYDYKRYAGAMPPLVQKLSQSFTCGADRGSLFFFEYASSDARDQAELFAKPILSREEEMSSAVAIRDWTNGFVVVSFKTPPAELVAALDRKLAGGTAPAVAEKQLALPPIPSAPPPVTAPAKPHDAGGVVQMVPMKNIPAALPTANTATTSNNVPLDQMVTPKPAAPLSTEPPMDAAHAVTTAVPALPPLPPLVVAPPPPRKVVPPPPVVPKVVMPPAPVVLPPPVVAKPVPHPVVVVPPPPPSRPKEVATVQSLPEIEESVLANFAQKLDCANPDLKEQGKVVCSILDDFKNGAKPRLPQGSTEIILGPAYTVDEYGRLMDQHDDVVAGADWPGYVSFFSLVSAGGQQDFEIQSLIDARKAQKVLPTNGTLQTIRASTMKKRFPVVPTNGASSVILAGGPRRIYIRKTGDHWVIFGPQGASSDQQIRANVVISELY
jgi:hypothetical protein